MCKVMMISGISKKVKNEELWQFLATIGGYMSIGNSDGLGYAAVDYNGDMHGERWLKNDDAFLKRNTTNSNGRMKSYKGFLKPTTIHNTFGIDTNEIAAITLHTRFATCGKQFINTHPFVDTKRDTSLIHNGVISNDHKLKEKYKYPDVYSSCDSEVILRDYLYNDVNINAAKISKIVNNLDGYFACGVLTRDGNNRRVMDIFKCNRASLAAGYVKELGAMVFTTSIGDLEAACSDMEWDLVDTYEVEANALIRLDAITGEVLEKQDFKKIVKHYQAGDSAVNAKVQKAKKLREQGYSYSDIKNSWDYLEMSSSEREALDEKLDNGDEISEDEMLALLNTYDYTWDDFYQDGRGRWFLIEGTREDVMKKII